MGGMGIRHERPGLWAFSGWRRALVVGVFCTIPVGMAGAGPLDRVMGVMEEDFQALTRALFHEDYPEAKAAAQRLANHPTPGFAEKLALLGRFGTGAAQFQEYDGRVKEAAKKVAAAAEARALDRLIDSYHRLVDSCLACHRKFGGQFNQEKGE